MVRKWDGDQHTGEEVAGRYQYYTDFSFLSLHAFLPLTVSLFSLLYFPTIFLFLFSLYLGVFGRRYHYRIPPPAKFSPLSGIEV